MIIFEKEFFKIKSKNNKRSDFGGFSIFFNFRNKKYQFELVTLKKIPQEISIDRISDYIDIQKGG